MRHQVAGNRHVDRRLVHVIDELWQQLGHVGLQHDLVIVGVQLLIYAAGPLNVVGNNVIAQVFRFDADGVRANASAIAVMLHHRHDRRRINASGKKRAQRHVRDHLEFDDAIEGLQDLLLPPDVALSFLDLVE